MYNISLWAVVFTHYKHKNHPLVAERFGFILNHIKDYGSAGKAEKPQISGQIYIPMMVTKRMAAACIIAGLVRYTISPILLLGFL
jgi:hypothetical protein